jgi:hypothetical protein
VTTEWRSLLGRSDIDAVVVATPNALHAEQSIDVPRRREARPRREADGRLARGVRRDDRGLRSVRRLAHGGAQLALPRRGDRDAGPDRLGCPRRGREDARVRGPRELGPAGLVRRSGARRRGRARRHGRARDRHGAVRPGRSGPRARVRRDLDPVRELRGRRRRHRVGRVVERRRTA